MNISIEERLEQLLDQFGENEVVEFKEANNDFNFRKLGKYFSALSNEANLKDTTSAWLVFGVKDDQTVVGTNYRLQLEDLHSLKHEIAQHTTHYLTFIEIYIVTHSSRRVILFEIPPAPAGMPIAWQGHYYGRYGESLGPLNISEFECIRQQSLLADWSVGVCDDALISDLSTEAIEVAREAYGTKHPHLASEIESWDIPTFLNKSKLAINGKITHAALLLLGNPESSHMLSPANSTISWILKDRDGVERDYEHFDGPLLLSAQKVFSKIRNLKYRYMVEGTMFPEEVDQYDPYIIREALNNAIAHQDYELGGKITIVEFEDGRLCFSNMGSFIPGSVEQVIQRDAPESRYRNSFLTDAMVNLNMIDTIGSGIRKMFVIQKNRFFPLPEYEIDQDRVQVTITGHVLDINYAHKLVEIPDLSLANIILLDRVQKRKPLTTEQAAHLREMGLIEGRKPNYLISASVAKSSGDKAQYIRNKGLSDQYYKQLICEYIEKYESAHRKDINDLLLDKLPDILDKKQKANKVKNLLQALKLQGIIYIKGRIWKMSKK